MKRSLSNTYTQRTVTSGVTTWLYGKGFTQFYLRPTPLATNGMSHLHLFRKHSPDGVVRARWCTSGSAYYSFIDPERTKGCVGL